MYKNKYTYACFNFYTFLFIQLSRENCCIFSWVCERGNRLFEFFLGTGFFYSFTLAKGKEIFFCCGIAAVKEKSVTECD